MVTSTLRSLSDQRCFYLPPTLESVNMKYFIYDSTQQASSNGRKRTAALHCCTVAREKIPRNSILHFIITSKTARLPSAFFDMFHVFPPGLHNIQNSKIPNTTPLPPDDVTFGKMTLRESGPSSPGVKLKVSNTDFLGTWKIFEKFHAESLLHDPMKENVGNMKKYVGNMKKYVKNMKKYV